MQYLSFSYYLDMFANVILLLAIFLNIPLITRLKLYTKLIIILIIALGSSLIPFYMGSNLLWIMRGVLSDLSTSTIILLIAFLLNNLFMLKVRILSTKPAIIIVFCCTFLYLSTLGVLPFDIYDLGFRPDIYFISLLFIITLIIWRFNRLNALALLGSLIMYYFRGQHSINLWDYLVDPILWICSIIVLVTDVFRKYIK